MCVYKMAAVRAGKGDKVYLLEGHEGEVNKLAGEKITVKGTVNDVTVAVESVVPAAKTAE
jgi:hypothetical protein